jgi:hypothetical protein
MDLGNEVIDIRLDWPSSILICGAPASGKSHLCLDLIDRKSCVFKQPVQHVVYVYQSWEPNFDILKEKDPSVHFVSDLFQIDDTISSAPDDNWLVFIDDQIINIEQNQKASQFVAEFFVYRSTHENLVPVFITHNLFSKSVRLISLNSRYIVLFKAIRDRTRIDTRTR